MILKEGTIPSSVGTGSESQKIANSGRRENGGYPLLPAYLRGLGLELKIQVKDATCRSAIVTCASDSSRIINAIIIL